jgi:sugar lactone lactonase YvrE
MKTKIQNLLITLALLAGIHQTTAQAQNLFESDFNSGNIYEFTTNGTQSTFASGLSGPIRLAFNSAGNLFELDYGSGNIYEFTNNAGTLSSNYVSFASGLNNPRELAFDSNGNLFVANTGGHNVLEFTNNAGVLSTNYVIFASGLNGPLAFAFNGAGNLFVADAGTISTLATIYEYTPLGAQSTLASVPTQPFGLAFDSAGDLFVTDVGGNGPNEGDIYEFTNNAGTLSSNYVVFALGLYYPEGLAFDSAGNLFEADGGSGNIFEFTNGVAAEKGTFASGLNHPGGLAFSVIAANSTFSVSIKMFAGIILKNGQIGSNYLIQATSNLSTSNWTTLTNVTLPSSPYIFIDYSSYTNSQQFYRAVQQ